MGISAAELYYPYPEESSTSSGKENKTQTAPEPSRKEAIKVVAVGGGGGNALNHIISKGLEGVDLLAFNTDIRSLEMSRSSKKVVLGQKVTKGLGAGALPEVGEKAARESLPEIREYLRGADMVYLAAGMGGGTGTGALPVIAAAAKELGILTVAVVTKPFMFEGARRRRYAEEGIEKLRPNVDALIIVPNDRLLEISHKETTLTESFSMADEILRQAVQGVTDLVTRPGMVNVDFADLKSVMKQAGTAVMGIGSAKGEDRIDKAVAEALESPLMECSMQGAKGVLMNITCGGDLGIFEIQRAAAYVENIISEDATFVWGCVEDDDLEGAVEVVIVATGFEQGERASAAPKFSEPQPIVRPQPVERQKPFIPAEPQPEQTAAQWLSSGEQPEQEDAASKTALPMDSYDPPTFARLGKAPRKPQIV